MKHSLKLVGIGASAGGLDALIDFFKRVPGNCDVAFLVIQHLSPNHESIMDELIAPHAKLPVVKAGDGMQLEGGMIYLCPAGMIPRVNELSLELKLRPNDKSVILPIDILFESIGRTLGSSAAAVVLSGTGTDGSTGILSVEQGGGIVAAQSPETADFSGMPQSAISTGKCHVIAPAEKLWSVIKTYADGERSTSMVEVPELAGETEPMPFEAEEYSEVFKFLEDQFGLDFSFYRINSVSRRLNRRMELLAVPDIKTYLEYLEANRHEVDSLYKDLLIGVTEFFRDADSFNSLSREVIKSVMKAGSDRDFRIWSAGCATGQEPYSLYMLADEVKREVGFSGRIIIFATDVFKPSINFAGKGLYTSNQLSGLSAERLERYFLQADSAHYKIQPHVRESIIFAQHNFLIDPPFTNMDIVSCRNVLIYLKAQTQEAALSAFAYALRDQGYLFLGGSESLGKIESSFKSISNKAKIFQKYSSQLDLKQLPKRKLAQKKGAKKHRQPNISGAVKINRDLLSAYDSLLERFAPSGFLVNADREVLHYFGDAADFCVNVSGRVSLDVAEQLDKDLRLAVMALMHRAEQKNEGAASRGVHCLSQKGECVVDVVIEPLQDLHGEVRNYLIEIQPQKEQDSDGILDAKERVLENMDAIDAGEQVKILEEELKYVGENLEAANEELQVSNEELQSTVEELQVANEELLSTNEELHSLNEELTMLNAEYDRKNVELIDINTSHENLLESNEDGVLSVDKDMLIRRFNTAIKSAFSMMPNDIGRPLCDIAYQMDGDNNLLLSDVQSVLETGERVERETDLINGRLYMKRITPSRGAGGEIDGALLTFTDVTEVRALEKRFKFALGSAELSWWDWDMESGTIEVTSGGSCLLGDDCLCSARDRDGWMEMVHPDDHDEVCRALDDCLEGRTENWDCEHRFRMVSGHWLWVSNKGIITQRDAKGNPTEMMGVTQNIDSYKRALNEAQNHRALLDATDEISKVGVWDYDLETQRIIWSDEIIKLLEVDEDFVPSAENTYNLMPPSDRKRLQQAFEQINSDGTPYDLQLRFITAKGREILCRTAGRASFDERGKIVRVYGIFQDITDLVLMQNEVEAFFDLSPDFQAALAVDGGFKVWNPSWEKNLGYSEDELLSMNISDLVAEDDRPAFREVYGKAAAGTLVANYETRVVPKADMQRDCSDAKGAKDAWISWSFSSEPKLSTVFVSARCVTDQKEAQNALQEARLRAEEANRAKSDFLAVMSHELRTPLNPILGFTDMLIEDAKDEEQKEILNTIVDSGSHMLSLINEILDYSKIDAGKAQLDPVEFSLLDLVENKVHLMTGLLKGKSIKLNYSIDWGDIDESRVPVVIGDQGMIRQVCRNILTNAIKFTTEGQIDFNVSVQQVEAYRAQVRFDIKDSGIGIPQKDLSKIFNPFTQVQSGSTREYGGTGLGLAICKRLVDLMDGDIFVESNEGKGSKFTFILPLVLRYVEDNAINVDESPEPDKVDSITKLSGRVLLVEDNESNAYYINTLVKTRGVEAEVVTQGELALEKLWEHAYDLVLLDLHMPGIGGLETLKRIRSSEKSSTRKVPVYILTADASAKASKGCQKHGSDGLLVKPVSPCQIYAVLEEYLDEA